MFVDLTITTDHNVVKYHYFDKVEDNVYEETYIINLPTTIYTTS